jgi:hypothetical protein
MEGIVGGSNESEFVGKDGVERPRNLAAVSFKCEVRCFCFVRLCPRTVLERLVGGLESLDPDCPGGDDDGEWEGTLLGPPMRAPGIPRTARATVPSQEGGIGGVGERRIWWLFFKLEVLLLAPCIGARSARDLRRGMLGAEAM